MKKKSVEGSEQIANESRNDDNLNAETTGNTNEHHDTDPEKQEKAIKSRQKAYGGDYRDLFPQMKWRPSTKVTTRSKNVKFMRINLFSHVLSILNHIFLLFEMNIEAKQCILFVL